MKLKRFLLFGGCVYYPSGGWDDFIGDFNTLKEAKSFKIKLPWSVEWKQIVDTKTGEITHEKA